jgi:hypothetical protein
VGAAVRAAEPHRADTVLVVGPPLAGASSVAAALHGRLDGCAIVEPAGLAPGRIPDAVVFVTSAAAPMSACDAALLDAAVSRTDAVVAAVAKIDLHRTWRAVLDINRTAMQPQARARAVPWVGVAADPEIGPLVIRPLVDAVRAELDDEHRRRRNLLRASEWALQRRIAGREREAATRTVLRGQAVRRSAARVRIQQARLQLAAQARAMRKMAIATFTDNIFAARGRFLVRSTWGSISRSQRSLTTHPAPLVARVPKIITPTRGKGGKLTEAKKIAQRAGIIKINRPAGLSQRNRRIIVNQVGSVKED